jgi:hypothetical protein
MASKGSVTRWLDQLKDCTPRTVGRKRRLIRGLWQQEGPP